MTRRVTAVVVTMVVFAGLNQWSSRFEAAPARKPLMALGQRVGDWRGREAPLEEKVVRVLGVSDFINRYYVAKAMPTVSLYIGYYASQRTGQTIHSPMKCLPGTGWQPLETDVRTLTLSSDRGSRQLQVNRYLVQKGTDRMVVYFWYQMRDRVITSEYMAKVFLIEGALLANRTDGALVRVIVSIPDNSSAAGADAAAEAFIQSLFPMLSAHVPA